MYNAQGRSYFDLAVEIMQAAGQTEYYIDPRLKHLYSKNPIPRVKCKEALQIIANACRCVLSQSRDGLIQIKSNFNPLATVSSNGEAPYSTVGSMGDSYAIHESKEFLEELLQGIIAVANELGITVNTRKTRICKLSSLWRFLQVQYSLTDTGRVIQKITPKRLTSMRRKMKKLVHILTEKEFDDWYGSWFRNHYRIMSKLQRENMDTLYNNLKKEVYHNVQNHPG